MSFAPGDLVVCVDDSGLEEAQGRLDRGRVYTVRDAFVCPISDVPGVYLGEVHLGIHPELLVEFGYEAYRFRPVRDTDISIFTEMLTKAPTEKEPAL